LLNKSPKNFRLNGVTCGGTPLNEQQGAREARGKLHMCLFVLTENKSRAELKLSGKTA